MLERLPFRPDVSPSRHAKCECSRVLSTADICRWLLLLLSALLSGGSGSLLRLPPAPGICPVTARTLQGMAPYPWPGSLPGPWLLARVGPEARCQGWTAGPSFSQKKTPSALDSEGAYVTIQGPSPDLSLAATFAPSGPRVPALPR